MPPSFFTSYCYYYRYVRANDDARGFGGGDFKQFRLEGVGRGYNDVYTVVSYGYGDMGEKMMVEESKMMDGRKGRGRVIR